MLFSVFYKVYLKGEKITDTDGYVQGWSGLGGVLHSVSVERVPPPCYLTSYNNGREEWLPDFTSRPQMKGSMFLGKVI